MFAKGVVIDNDWLKRGDPEWEYHDEDADGVTDTGEDELHSVDDIVELEDRGEVPAAGLDAQNSHQDSAGELEGSTGDGTSVVAQDAMHISADAVSQPGWVALKEDIED